MRTIVRHLINRAIIEGSIRGPVARALDIDYLGVLGRSIAHSRSGGIASITETEDGVLIYARGSGGYSGFRNSCFRCDDTGRDMVPPVDVNPGTDGPDPEEKPPQPQPTPQPTPQPQPQPTPQPTPPGGDDTEDDDGG